MTLVPLQHTRCALRARSEHRAWAGCSPSQSAGCPELHRVKVDSDGVSREGQGQGGVLRQLLR